MITRYENAAAPQLCALLEDDLHTFAVMRNILQGMFGPVGKILTDGVRWIICYTCPPYPAWAWTPQDASQAEMAQVWAVMQQELPLDRGYRFNVREAFAQYIQSTPEGAPVRVDTRLAAYGADEVQLPQHMAQGELYAVSVDDLDAAAAWAQALSEEENLDLRPYEAHRQEMAEFIDRKRLFMWKTPEGKPVAMCTVSENDGLGYVGHVYTPKAHRRQGYAASLVGQITRILIGKKMKPALYVNAQNTAASACYEKLGYTQMGSICTIGL